MFRLILRCQNVGRITRLNSHVRRCSINSSNQIDQDKAKETIELTDQLNEFKELVKNDKIDNLKSSKDELDNLIEKLYEFDNVKDFLNAIDSHLTSLKSKHLELIYYKLNRLIIRSKIAGGTLEIKQFVGRSLILNSLLDHTSNQLKKLESDCLITITRSFEPMNLNPKSKIVLNIMIELKKRLDEDKLDNKQITNWLKNMHLYLNGNLYATLQFFQLNQYLIEKFRQLVLNDRLDLNDENLIEKCYFIFLKPENDPEHQVANYITEKLLATDHQINFTLSAKLLRAIALNSFMFQRNRLRNRLYNAGNNEIVSSYTEFNIKYEKRILFPRILSQLIDKCNEAIYITFFEKQSKEDLDLFLVILHRSIEEVNFEFPNFYSEKLLNFLIPHLIENMELKKSLKHSTFRLVKNYSLFKIYDKKLMKLIYNQFCNSDDFRNFLIKRDSVLDFYFLLTNYRLKFVDHHYLAKQVWKISPNFQVLTRNQLVINLKFLSSLILNDFYDKDLFNNLVEILVQAMKENLFNELGIIRNEDFQRIVLAKIYLPIFFKINGDRMKSTIEQILDQSTYSLADQKPKIVNYYYQINNKLQSNGYLSNGLYINAFAIYDHSLKDLIPLTEHRYFFNKIDKMQVSIGQEM